MSVMDPFQRPGRKGWWIKVRDITRPKGRQWILRKGGATRDEAVIAKAKLEEKTRLVKAGLADRRQIEVAEKSKVAIDEVISDYERHLKKKRRTRGHVKEAIRCIRTVIKGIEAKCLDDIDTGGVEDWLDDVIDDGKSARTRNVYRDRLHAFLNFSIRRKMLAINPVSQIEKLNEDEDPREQSRALTFEEFERLLAATPDPIRRLYYLMAGRTGLRWSEIARLTWVCVDLEDGWIRLRAKGTKSKRGDDVPLSDELIEALKAVKPLDATATTPVFTTKPILRTLKKDLERAGIPYENEHGQVDRKSLRKMFCSHLQAMGVPLATAVKLMRHTDPRLTSRIYTDPQLLDLRGATNRLSQWRQIGDKSGPHKRNIMKQDETSDPGQEAG